MPRRHDSTDDYRYGFQGQEKDDEIKGEGNSINYTFRMHDPRLGRFFATDPLTSRYPHYTPYSFSGNKVLAFSELEGAEEIKAFLLSKDFFSYMDYDINTQKGKFAVRNSTNSVNVMGKFNTDDGRINTSSGTVQSLTRDEISNVFEKGVIVPETLFTFFKNTVLGAKSPIMPGLVKLQKTLSESEEYADYAPMVYDLSKDVILKVYDDLEKGRASLIVKGAPDIYKTVKNEKGEDEHIKYSDGYTFTLRYKTNKGNLYLQLTYHKEETNLTRQAQEMAKPKPKPKPYVPQKPTPEQKKRIEELMKEDDINLK